MSNNQVGYDFFEAQRYHKKTSMMLYGLFSVLLAIHIAVLAFIFAAAATIASWGTEEAVELGTSIWWYAVIALGIFVFIGMIIQWHRLHEGGVSVAAKMQAVRLFLDKTGNTEGEAEFFPSYIKAGSIQKFPSAYARFYEFSEQMSIASGVPMPLLYVLPEEMSVNAFVAGFNAADTVMVLTQGAVENLDNESLYALIAHQYSGIIYGDAKLNLKISVIGAGLSWLYDLMDAAENTILGTAIVERTTDIKTAMQENIKKDMERAKISDLASSSPIATQISQTAEIPTDKEHWIAYLRQDRAQRKGFIDRASGKEADSLDYNRNYEDGNYRSGIDAGVGYGNDSTLLFIVFMVIKGLGWLGAVSHDWLASRFSHHRLFLADATSMQLNRSDGIIHLLRQFNRGQISSFLRHTYDSHTGYFFFAPTTRQSIEETIEEDWLAFSPHPAFDVRLSMLQDRTYFDQSLQIVGSINTKALAQSHDEALKHAAVLSLFEEVAYEMMEYTAAPADQVIDGRLVTSEEWSDWSPIEDTATPTEATITDITTAQYDPSLPEIITQENLKELPIAWEITKHQRTALGALVFLESVLLMRFASLPKEHKFDLATIYLQNTSKRPKDSDTPIYAHSVGDELLGAVTQIDRRADGVLMLWALQRLKNHLNNPNEPINEKRQKTLQAYYRALNKIIQGTPNPDPKPIQNHATLLEKINELHRGLVLALLLKTLQAKLKTALDARLSDRILTVFADFWNGQSKAQQVQLLLLVFLISVQDNSILLGNLDKVWATVQRSARLAMLPFVIEDSHISQFVQKTHQIGVGEWAILLLCLTDVLDTKNYLETLQTAFLHDAQITQKEQDILSMLGELLSGTPS